jgi:hypothetical protein
MAGRKRLHHTSPPRIKVATNCGFIEGDVAHLRCTTLRPEEQKSMEDEP